MLEKISKVNRLADLNQEKGENEGKSKNSAIATMLCMIYNSLENIVIFLLMLNAVFYPNYPSILYFVVSFILTVFSLSKKLGRIQFKKGLAILLIIAALAFLSTKTYYLVSYRNST